MQRAFWVSAAALGASVLCAAQVAPPASSPTAREAISAALARLLQGDAAAAAELLRRPPVGEFVGRDAAFRACMLARFDAGADGSLPADLPPIAARALGIYRAYWRAALRRPAGSEAEGERLRRNLARLLGLQPSAEFAALEGELSRRLRPLGLHALMGRTPPLRELMLWREQREEQREVPLPEGRRSVKVVLLDGFSSLGWSNFASCGRSSSGGWVGSDAIYAVVPSWPDLTGERFLVSFLGHEAQHFADRERFASLDPWELEYRAKLAELAMAESSLADLVRAFIANRRDDPAIPHSFANGRVIAALQQRLGLGDPGGLVHAAPAAIRDAAGAELRADSERRSR